jgi:cobalt-precorrin 5A hydrolase / precorrin-3B C17-methyltransferase
MASLWIGLGYQKQTSAMAIDRAIIQVFSSFNLETSWIAGLGTIDRKVTDPEISIICQSKGWQLQFFSAAELAIIQVPRPSITIKIQVNTPTVAEGAAILSAGQGSELLVPKQICWQAGKALTIAVARAADADRISCC